MKINNDISARPVIEPMLSLINVVFLLLIFFLVVGHITTEQQIEIQMLASENQHKSLSEPSEDWLYINLDGECFYHDKPLKTVEFGQVLPVQQTLYVAVDASLPMGDLQPIIDELEQLDIADISLITRLEESHQ
ncbi:Biopolymer transport exbD protein [Shewanella piezotolerans WP3]|uniref:Biopolymer transport exbD protein n=1 Tax=Shewanella piezotolerans (strain WP3 / JCM 13877) TaxID=225849 RepID=B8CPT1_SHEPW|nr:biopolymer transporter ExbD [Shewanella piezotolerans]ACJ29794.1 Biopolymer transport exbD protein [Shewanella piezotolerans WP3]